MSAPSPKKVRTDEMSRDELISEIIANTESNNQLVLSLLKEIATYEAPPNLWQNLAEIHKIYDI